MVVNIPGHGNIAVFTSENTTGPKVQGQVSINDKQALWNLRNNSNLKHWNSEKRPIKPLSDFIEVQGWEETVNTRKLEREFGKDLEITFIEVGKESTKVEFSKGLIGFYETYGKYTTHESITRTFVTATPRNPCLGSVTVCPRLVNGVTRSVEVKEEDEVVMIGGKPFVYNGKTTTVLEKICENGVVSISGTMSIQNTQSIITRCNKIAKKTTLEFVTFAFIEGEDFVFIYDCTCKMTEEVEEILPYIVTEVKLTPYGEPAKTNAIQQVQRFKRK